jgi:hypothetical protein
MSEDINHLDFEPEDRSAQYALRRMNIEAEQFTPIEGPGWRKQHPKLAKFAAAAILLTPIGALGFGGYELGKSFDGSNKSSSLELAKQHEECLSFIGTVARSGQGTLTVNPSLLSKAETNACGLEGVSSTQLDSTYDYNLPQGAKIKAVELPSQQSLRTAVQADIKDSKKGQALLSENEGIGVFLGTFSGLFGIMGISLGLDKRRSRRKITE